MVSVLERNDFIAQGRDYVEELTGNYEKFKVVLEAGTASGWYSLLGKNYHIVSVETFGESGPAEKVAEYLGFTAEKIAADILDKLN